MAKLKSKLYTVGSNIDNQPIKKVSKSIRSKITSNYLLIYTVISLSLIVLLLIGTLYTTYEITENMAYEFVKDATNNYSSIIDADNITYNKDYINKYWIIDTESGQIIATSTSPAEFNKDAFFENRKSYLATIITTQSISNYFYFRQEIKGKIYEFYLTVDGTPLLDVAGIYFIILFVIIIVFLFFGMFIMLIFGSFNTQRYLSPLKDISNLTTQINSDNLNMRLDVQSARYELKELVMTINNMLDRIQIGYLKQKQFVSDVSHELRTPISIIDGYANMLKRWAKDDEKVFDESLEAIIDETQSMKTVVENLLLLARYDNNTLVLDKEKYSLSEQVYEMYKELMMLNNNKHIIENTIEADVFFHGDKIKIRQAIREFCKNAIKYTPVQGNITLTLSKTRNRAIINIKDTGIGIARKDIGRIFERFYRADRARNRTEEGYGLGLSIARAIIVAHKGTISLKSKDGVGTEIEIMIPLNQKD